MKLKNILLAFLPAVIISCNDSREAVDPSVFSVRSSLLTIGADGGLLEVAYSVKGAAEGIVAEAVPMESWIELDGADAAKITLKVSANDTGADRMGSVVLSGDNVRNLTLHISQSKVSDSEPVYNNFSFEVSDITSSSLELEVTPVNPSGYYYTNLLTEAVYSTFTGTGLIEAYVQSMLEAAAVYDADPRNFLFRGYLNTVEAGSDLDLRDDTDYRIFAFELDFDEERNPEYNGRIESVKIRTARATQVPMSFEFERGSGAVVHVTPSTDSYSYVCGIASREQWNEYTDKKDAARDFVDIAKQYNMLNESLYYGERDVDFMYLVEEPGTYVVYAVGYRNSESDRGITTDICYEEFTF